MNRKDFEQKRGFIMVGFPGSGKSTIAEKIQRKYPNTPVLSSDKIREELFLTSRFDEAGDDEIQAQSKIAYQVLYERAVEYIKQDKRVILDATHVQTAKRLNALAYLLMHVPPQTLMYIVVNTPPEIIAQRMKKKQGKANKSETFFDGWQRVYGYFLERKKRGEISWPRPEEGITIASHTEIESLLR